MSSQGPRKAHNELLARRKALHTLVYISGLAGAHTLQVGLAYYYRGHYMYAYPAETLIEPLPYSTRRGIAIQGIVSASAPRYDRDAADLRQESEVGALEKSVQAEMRARDALRLGLGSEETVQTDASVDKLARLRDGDVRDELLSPNLCGAPPAGRRAQSTASLAALDAFTPRHGLAFLAASAPGSRLASRAASPAGLRPASSHIGLLRLGCIKGPDPPSPIDVSEANSVPEDAPSRPASAVEYLYGLGDHALSAEHLPRPDGRVAPCGVHGEECDGAFVAEPWLSEQMKRGLGFVEDVPMIEMEGRVMVDWAGLLEETRREEK